MFNTRQSRDLNLDLRKKPNILRLKGSQTEDLLRTRNQENGEKFTRAGTSCEWQWLWEDERKLNNHCLPKKNKHHARYTFSKQKIGPTETIGSYATRMRYKARECEFGDQEDERILEHLIHTIRDEELANTAIQKRWDLHHFIENASRKEEISRQVKDMKEDFKVTKIYSPRKHQPRKTPLRQKGGEVRGKEAKQGHKCDYWGKTGFHKRRKDCPAYGKQVHQIQPLCCVLQVREENRTETRKI